MYGRAQRARSLHKHAYLEKVKTAHPDHGGSPEAFGKLEDAYQQALQYVSFRSDRRGWIGARMEEYLAQQSVIADLEQKGANVVIESIDWLQRSFGEFAALTERVIAVHISDKSQVTDVLNVIKQEHLLLDGVKQLDLSGCEVSDDVVFELRVLRSLMSRHMSKPEMHWTKKPVAEATQYICLTW